MKSNDELIDAAKCMNLIYEAQEAINGYAHVTPVMNSRCLNRKTGCQVFLKCENFQKVGAFKFRGAFNALSKLDEQQRRSGVLTFSSGNHAQAMALAGRLLDIPVTVVMPKNAPLAKIDATKSYGADVVFYDPEYQDREQVAAELPVARKAVLIPPFDHYDVIAGQGTCALEFHHWFHNQQGCDMDILLVPVGGGGLLAGSAVASRHVAPNTQVIGVEPQQADDAAQSLKCARRIRIDNPDTIADGARTPCVGRRNFVLMHELVDNIVTVSEQSIARAVIYLFERLKIVVEPAGALGIAALMELEFDRQNIGVIISGGNVDRGLFAQLLSCP